MGPFRLAVPGAELRNYRHLTGGRPDEDSSLLVRGSLERGLVWSPGRGVALGRTPTPGLPRNLLGKRLMI